MTPKNDPRDKRTSSKARRRRDEEQLDLFPRASSLAPATPPLGAARRAAPRNETGRKRVDNGVLIQLGLR